MTTDRTALEAARDALPPLPEPMTYGMAYTTPGSVLLAHPERACVEYEVRSHGGTARLVRLHDDEAMRDYAAQAVTAALSSPPVLPAEPVAYVIDWQDIGEGAAQSFYYGLGAKENMQAAINYAASIPRSAKVTPLTPYAAPQSAAPALDDARDAIRIELTSEQVQALYLCLLHDRPRPAFGWMEKPLTDIQAVLEPIHGRLHVKEFPF